MARCASSVGFAKFIPTAFSFCYKLVGVDGKPAAGSRVTAEAADGLEVAYAARIATPGSDGRFRLGPLRAGEYKVYPGKGEGAPVYKLKGAKEVSVTMSAGTGDQEIGDVVVSAGGESEE